MVRAEEEEEEEEDHGGARWAWAEERREAERIEDEAAVIDAEALARSEEAQLVTMERSLAALKSARQDPKNAQQDPGRLRLAVEEATRLLDEEPAPRHSAPRAHALAAAVDDARSAHAVAAVDDARGWPLTAVLDRAQSRLAATSSAQLSHSKLTQLLRQTAPSLICDEASVASLFALKFSLRINEDHAATLVANVSKPDGKRPSIGEVL